MWLQTRDTPAWKMVARELVEISELKLQDWVLVSFLIAPLCRVHPFYPVSKNWNTETSVGSVFNSLPPGVAVIIADPRVLISPHKGGTVYTGHPLLCSQIFFSPIQIFLFPKLKIKTSQNSDK